MSDGKKKESMTDYERHLIPISWDEFPFPYIETLHKECGTLESESPIGVQCSCAVPIFHFGIYLFRDEVTRYAKQCWDRLHEKPHPQRERLCIPLLLNRKIELANQNRKKEYEEGRKAYDKSGNNTFSLRLPPAGRENGAICVLISTNEPHTLERSKEELDRALAVLREEFKDLKDREPMWYFSRLFFGPRKFGYAEFDAERVVGGGLLAHLPERVQTTIKDGTVVPWSHTIQASRTISGQLAEMILSDHALAVE
ncbi:hypothetical protein L226DRAFT_615499 [Lentinus tigrinus ALCF2SS1-7]|uniref:Uncharacterized protein n=1 Tax=Lentinus tigrinus ALCF2SS1-6 TaxID=1328759 RepID=A0A5C2RZ71_9APHY|nr:hypothetical protein L227DRAFT_656219 [Lentinus tigrinus ALCF2SS1-6]RPD71489.1 hypothetical protein L226DRAFT_615499 [Lentinus tigrinus ALCF2SS1-7]